MTDDPQMALEFFEERAAIREYDGHFPREEAEALAREDIERHKVRVAAKSEPRSQGDSKEHLRSLVEREEYLIFLYGQNPHLCFISTHSACDDGTKYPIMRGDALAIMGAEYVLHSGHEGPGGKAKVYRRVSKRTTD